MLAITETVTGFEHLDSALCYNKTEMLQSSTSFPPASYVKCVNHSQTSSNSVTTSQLEFTSFISEGVV